MVLEKVSLKQSREHWLLIPYGVERRVRVELKSVKAFYIFSLGKESRKFCREFNVELHGTDDDRELMALYNARREESGLAEYDRSVSRLREAVHEALVQRSHTE